MNKREVNTDNITQLTMNLFETIVDFIGESKEGVSMAEIELSLCNAHIAAKHYQERAGVINGHTDCPVN